MNHQFALIVLSMLLILLNGFFVAAEFGLVKLRSTRIKAIVKRYGWRGKILLKVHQNLDAYLSACQLGITLSSLGLGWVGEPAFSILVRALFIKLGIMSEAAVHAAAFSIAFFIISYLHIVVGELVPKSMAIRMSEKVGLWTAPPLFGFYWLMYPAIWFLNKSANWMLHIMGLNFAHNTENHYSAAELKLILRTSHSDADFTSDEWRVLAQALDFRDLVVTDLMRPFHETIALSAADGLEKNLDHIVRHRFSRYPYLDEQGHVIGVIHLKDVFFAMRNNTMPTSLVKLIRPVLTVPPHLSATTLFRKFREGVTHFAIVANQDARPQGFITLDNLLSALVGEIRDEFRRSENDWLKLDDGSLLGKASLPIFTLERALGIDIIDDEVDSVGGLILQRLGNLPEEGQRIEFERFTAVVKKMIGPRMLLVRIYPKE